jgi:pimeloyl-ACP methyl ester carboxylesterase
MTRMESGLAEVAGGKLAWEAAGEGPGVAFLHPGLWDSRVWDEQFGVFSRTYRVLRYDLRGYGRSSRPVPGKPYSHVDDLAAVMDAAGLDRAALIGNSMGGRIAIDFTLTHPERVSALVLAATNVGGFEETEEEARAYADLDREIEQAVEAEDAERAMELELSVWATALGTEDPAGARIRRIAFENLHVITMDESGAARLDGAFQRLPEIDAPTLVLPADHDPPVFRRLSEEVAARLPNARLVEIPETDHVIPVRRSAEFNRVVLGFLGEAL